MPALREHLAVGPGAAVQAVHRVLRADRAMGTTAVVRLGLSRSFVSAAGQPGKCWLMADGFFSLDDPQP